MQKFLPNFLLETKYREIQITPLMLNCLKNVGFCGWIHVSCPWERITSKLSSFILRNFENFTIHDLNNVFQNSQQNPPNSLISRKKVIYENLQIFEIQNRRNVWGKAPHFLRHWILKFWTFSKFAFLSWYQRICWVLVWNLEKNVEIMNSKIFKTTQNKTG